MTQMWRITNKGSWPEFSVDIIAKDFVNALDIFDFDQKKKGSSADRTQIIKAELIGETKHEC